MRLRNRSGNTASQLPDMPLRPSKYWSGGSNVGKAKVQPAKSPETGAGDRIRTRDPLFTKQLLYP